MSKPPARFGVRNAVLRRPLFEHRAGETQVTPDADARQASGPCGVPHPRWADVEQRCRLLNVK
jgi:hypothetical protein